MGRLDGKRALVTAAGQGIGRAGALAMALGAPNRFTYGITKAAVEGLTKVLLSPGNHITLTAVGRVETCHRTRGKIA